MAVVVQAEYHSDTHVHVLYLDIYNVCTFSSQTLILIHAILQECQTSVTTLKVLIL